MAESPTTADLLTFCRAIAAPLIAAAAREEGAEKAAQATADLLARTAVAGVDIGRLIGPEAEAERLALAALAAPLVAGLYERGGGQVPDEAALAKIVEPMRAAVAFAQGFGGLAPGEPQGPVAVLAALAPAVGAVGADPLGVEIGALADKLSERAGTLATALGADKGQEAALLAALAPLYAACHRGARDADAAWAAFAERAAMLEILAKSLAAPPPAKGQEGSEAPAPPPEAETHEEQQQAPAAPPPIRRSPAAPGAQAPKTDAPPPEAAPREAPPEAPQEAPPEAPKEAPKDRPPAGNPMTFFKKKKEE